MIFSIELINTEVEKIVSEIGNKKEDVIALLNALQKKFNYLPEEALRKVCEITQITPSEIMGISTFYNHFRHKPVGEHLIQVCTGTACHVKGAELVYDAFLRELNLKANEDTDSKGKFTLKKVACLGCCTIAPVIQIDNVTYGNVKTDTVSNILKDFLSQLGGAKSSLAYNADGKNVYGEIKIGLGSCCVASGSKKISEELEKSFHSIGVSPEIKKVGCVGMCHRVPLLEVCLPYKESVLYDKVKPEEVKKIISKHYKAPALTKRIKNAASDFFENLLFENSQSNFEKHSTNIRDPKIEAFLGRQFRIATEFSGEIDPLNLEEYIEKSGFDALRKVLSVQNPVEVINEIKLSGLRGRGGGGFATGKKWEMAYNIKDSIKYLICNGDEGDPGAFMDRMILESYPFRVIEGMCIAAFAIGANECFLYIRAEYPLAVDRMKKAIALCKERGILGKNIFGSEFSIDMKIVEGAGAFVCGEETALIASIQGERGNPVLRPPYPVEKGLWGHSTLVNNCETFATIPWIIKNGHEKFSKLGTEHSKGTKVFSLAGKVARGGLIEVPMGVTIREIVEEIGGGIEGGKRFKAVQIGGPSGGCLPARLADTKVDYEELTKVGAMMGSGGLLIMDENDCMVDIAKYFLTFTRDQSCGKCTYCRIGTKLMLDILNKICDGKGKEEDLHKLKEIAAKTKERSLCGLGKTAPNPVLTTLTYYEDEYIAHLDGKCPAKKCKSLITYSIDDNCIGCTICAQNCPSEAIKIAPYSKHVIIQENCTKCNICKQVCPNNAVQVD